MPARVATKPDILEAFALEQALALVPPGKWGKDKDGNPTTLAALSDGKLSAIVQWGRDTMAKNDLEAKPHSDALRTMTRGAELAIAYRADEKAKYAASADAEQVDDAHETERAETIGSDDTEDDATT